MVGAEIQANDPATLAARWSAVFDRPANVNAARQTEIALDDATLRFVPVSDGRGGEGRPASHCGGRNEVEDSREIAAQP